MQLREPNYRVRLGWGCLSEGGKQSMEMSSERACAWHLRSSELRGGRGGATVSCAWGGYIHILYILLLYGIKC